MGSLAGKAPLLYWPFSQSFETQRDQLYNTPLSGEAF